MEPGALSSEARVPIAGPRRYLGQLCKHFGHGILASYDEEYRNGRIAFPDLGVCVLEADEAGSVLVMHASAASASNLDRVEGIVGRHLQRFAFRDPVKVAWVRA